MARAALWVVYNVYCILLSVLIRVHLLKRPYLSISLPTKLLPVPLTRSVAPPSLASSLSSFPRSVHA